MKRARVRPLLGSLALALPLALACGVPADPDAADGAAKPAEAAVNLNPRSLNPRSLRGPTAKRAPVTGQPAVREQRAVVTRDGVIELYDQGGTLRVKILDPQASFQSPTLEDPTLNAGEQRPGANVLVEVNIPGLKDLHARREGSPGPRGEPATPHNPYLRLSQRVQALDAELASSRTELAAIWRDDTSTPEERRRKLFDRWDACHDAALERADAPLVVPASERALMFTKFDQYVDGLKRRDIERFIVETLPRGSPDAFSERELLAFNATKKSSRPFDPYAPPATAQPVTTPEGPKPPPAG